MRYATKREFDEGEQRANPPPPSQRNLSTEQWQDMHSFKGSNMESMGAKQRVDRLFGSYDDIFNNDRPSSPGFTSEEAARRIDSFTEALPNDSKSLIGMLDQLLRRRLDDWHYPNLGALGVWSGYCQAILNKLTSVHDKTEYENSFHTRNPQEILQTLSKKRAMDNCLSAWQRAYSDELGLIPHNSREEQEPMASQQRERALEAINNAEAACDLTAPGGAPNTVPDNTVTAMPRIAPQRRRVKF